MQWVMDSDRLCSRKIAKGDFINLKTMLLDVQIMYTCEHTFTDEEIHEWIDKNLVSYKNERFSYFAVIEKTTNQYVGTMGLLIEYIMH